MTQPPAFPNLQGHRTINLVTYRESGEPVSTPVWFAEVDGTLYVITRGYTGKVKRVRHTPAVTVAPCTSDGDLLGEAVEATARLIVRGDPDDPEAAIADAALDRRYGDELRSILAATPDIPRVFLAIRRAE